MLEEIVGEIASEHEKPEDIVREADMVYLLPGETELDKVSEIFHARFNDVEATTIGGLVSEVAGHIPHPGETVEHSGLRFEVLESTDRRVERVRVIKLHAEPEPHPQPQKSGVA